MSKTPRDRRPYIRPVTRISLPEINVKARWVLLVLFLAIAVVAFGLGIRDFLTTDPGWQEVEVTAGQPSCAQDFQLMYDFSQEGATAQYKQLQSLYTQSAEQLYRLFSPDVLEDGLYNVAYLNAHYNEPVQVEAELYTALRLIVTYGDRHGFLAPVMVEYDRVFQSESQGEALLYDPTTNEETKAWLREIVAYANDPQHIRLELGEKNQVTLVVSQEYANFCRDHELETVFDFGWMTNAFLADALAYRLAEAGFTAGYLASNDGFTRNLDARGNSYSMNIFTQIDKNIYMPGKFTYTGPMSLVVLRNFPMTEEDSRRLYAFSDGRVISSYVDPKDGMTKAATPSLVSYSASRDCGEILLQMVNLYIADELDTTAVNSLRVQDIYALWCVGQTIHYNDATLDLQQLPDTGEGFQLKLE